MASPQDRFFDWSEGEQREYCARMLRNAGLAEPAADQIAALVDIRKRAGVAAFHRELDKIGSTKK